MNKEIDILEMAALHPLHAEVGGKPAEYGDPRLAAAVRKMQSVSRPWTVANMIHRYFNTEPTNQQQAAAILTILAASRDDRAAVVLASGLDSGSLDIRVASTYGLMDYFMAISVNGGTEEHMQAVHEWWSLNKAKYSKSADATINAQLPKELAELMNADRIDTGVVGEGAASELYKQYQIACKSVLPLNCYLWWIIEKGTPAGKLWAAAALSARKPDEGKKALAVLVGDSSKVKFQSGCEVSNSSVTEIAESLLKKNIYLDFSIKKAE